MARVWKAVWPWLRRGLKGVGALLVLVVVIAIGFLIFLHTDPGRRWVKRQVEDALSNEVRGRVTIDRLSGSVFGNLTLHGVAIDDESGERVIEVDRMALDYSVLSLLDKRVHVNHARLKGARVVAVQNADGTINLAKLLAKKKKKEEPEKPDSGGGSAWVVRVDELTIEDGSATFARPRTAQQNIDAIAVDVRGIGIRGGVITTELVSARATWREQRVTAELTGAVGLADGAVFGGVELSGRDGEHELGRIAVTDIQAATDLSQAAARITGNVSPRARQWIPGESARKWRGAVAFWGDVVRVSKGEPLELELDGFVADAALNMVATVVPETKQAWASIVVSGIDPSAALVDAPPGYANVRVLADVNGFKLDAMRGSFNVDADGSVKGVDLRGAQIAGDIAGGKVSFDGAVAAVEGNGAVDGVVDLLAKPPTIERMNVRGFVGELRRLMPEGKLRGSAWVRARVKGNADALEVTGVARLRRIRQGNAWVPAATARFRVTGSVEAPVVSATVTAGVVRVGKDRFEAVSLRARSKDKTGKRIAVTVSAGTRRSTNRVSGGGTVTLGEQTKVQLGWLRGRFRGLTWRSTGGSRIALAKDGNVSISGLRLASRAGSVRVDGTLRGGLKVIVKRLTLSELASALHLPRPHPVGVIELRARVRQAGKRFLGNASGTLNGFAMARTRPQVNGTFSGTMGWRKTTLVADVAGVRIGKVTIDASARTPYNTLDIAGWKRNGSKLVRSVDASFKGIDLAGVQRFLGKRTKLRAGYVTGRARLGAGARRAKGEVKVHGVRIAGLRERTKAKLTINADAGRLKLSATLDGRVLGRVDADGEAAVPVDLLDVRRWQGLDEYAIIGATFNARQLNLQRVRKVVPTFPKLMGIATVKGQVSKHGRTTVISGRVGRLRNKRTAGRPVHAKMRATIGLTSSTVAVETEVKGKPVGTANATIAAGLRTWRIGGLDKVKQAVVTAKGRLTRMPLRLIADALDLQQRRRISGAMGATLDVSGTAIDPRVKVSADLSGARVDKIRFAKFDVKGNLGNKSAVAVAEARQRHGGTLIASVTMQRRGKQRLAGSITSSNFELAFLRGLERGADPKYSGIGGRATIEMTLGGTVKSPAPRGKIEIRNGTLRVRKFAPLHDAVVIARVTPNGVRGNVNARSGEGSLKAKFNGAIKKRTLANLVADVRTRKFPFVTSNRYKFRVDSTTKVSMVKRRGMWDVKAKVVSALVRLPGISKERSLKSIADLDDVVFTDIRRRLKRKVKKRKTPVSLAAVTPFMRVKVSAPETIRLRSELVKATATANLIVTLIDGDIVIEGVARTTRGRVEILDRRYDIRTAKLTFDGQVPANPRVNVNISHTFESMTLYVGLTGRATKIDPPTFRSDPGGYDRSTLLGFFLGRDPDSNDPDDTPLDEKAVTLASNFLANQLQAALRDYLPIEIDVFKVEVDDVATRRPSRVIVGKWINDDLYVGYRYIVEADETDNKNEVQVEYRLTKRWSLEGTYGDNNKGGVDLLWIRRY